MNVKLQSSSLIIQINNIGAEICSVKNNSGLEFIWQADKDVWARHAPVLFPIVGKLKEDKYIFENKEYRLPQHGFARDQEFKPIFQSDSECTFQLNSNSQTKSVFPFDFIFEINYQLKDASITTHYKIINCTDGLMPFSVGAHPGFNCPLLATEKFEDYYLSFESNNFSLTALNNGLRTRQKQKLVLADNKLTLHAHLFDNDALVFENSQINKISLCSSVSNHKITMECKNWPYFGIWGKKENQKFVCLEPWHGVADSENTKQMIENKEGILHLNSNQEFRCSFSMSFL